MTVGSELAAPSYPLGEADQTSRAVRLAALAKALAHPSRIQIVETLLRRHICIGCDIVEEIGLAASTTSEHLRILKEAGIIAGEIMRPRVCYSIEPTAVRPLIEFLELIEAKETVVPPVNS
jgi:ArsR family transcriptional regulator, arsenate/arsenite/antimonite-responsive transcriptional repressor